MLIYNYEGIGRLLLPFSLKKHRGIGFLFDGNYLTTLIIKSKST